MARRPPAHTRLKAKVRIGVSGWTYPPWRGDFYPRGLVHKGELAWLSRALTSIEINGSFYALQKPDSYARWFDETPEDFVFSVKGPRFVTHVRRLQSPHELLANFLASGPLRLGKKLGPMLWQLRWSAFADHDDPGPDGSKFWAAVTIYNAASSP